jgi:tetratricopeptide (TPR) repeat protein
MNQLASTTGSFTRRARKTMAGLPGLSAPADLIAARHCVDLLAARFKEDPADPRRNVWLAEALLQTQRDLRTLVRLRGVADPSSIITRTAIRQVARLGDETDGEDAALKLLRRAFALSASRVRRDEVDAVALHVLARVYLVRGMPRESLRLARLAASVDSPERADVLVTAARALLKLGRRDDAARTAERAARDGATLGYEVLARLLATERSDLTRDPGARIARLRELRRKVRPEDRARYAGAARTPSEVARAAKSAQWRKAGSTFTDAAGLAGRARVAIEKGLTT